MINNILAKTTLLFNRKQEAIFLWSCILTILLSVFVRSSVDIGADTAFYINYGKKVLEGKKYYYDFFESNFPISFYIYAGLYKISSMINVSMIIFSEIFINLMMILSLIFSNKILSKSKFFIDNPIYRQLLLLGFCVGFFLRIESLQLGEFGTKTSFLLILLLPYLSFSLIEYPLNRKNLIFKGLIMGLIPCIKPHYALFLIFVESYNLFKSKSVKFFFKIDILVAFIVLLLYLNFLFFYVPEFLEFMPMMWSEYYDGYRDFDRFIDKIVKIFGYYIAPLMLVLPIFIYKKINHIDRILLLFLMASISLISLEALGSVDQKVVFYTVFVSFLSYLSYFFFNSGYFDLAKNKFLFFMILLIPAFDFHNFFKAFYGILDIWWIVILAYLIYLRKKNFVNSNNIYFVFVVFVICSVFSMIAFSRPVSIVFNSIFFLIMLFMAEKNYSNYHKKFSVLLSIIFLVILSNIFYFHVISIKETLAKDADYTSPNELTDNMAYYIKNYAKKPNDSYIVLSQLNIKALPAYIYFDKKVYSKYPVINVFAPPKLFEESKYSIFSLLNDKKLFVFEYLFNDLKEMVENDNIKLLFVHNSPVTISGDYKCKISFIEYYLKDKKFRKLFFDNFDFHNRILIYKDRNNKLVLNRGKFSDLEISKQILLHDVEVYIRK